MAATIAKIEQAAAWMGCDVNTVWEYLVYLSLKGAAVRYAEFLSDCARSAFGV